MFLRTTMIAAVTFSLAACAGGTIDDVSSFGERAGAVRDTANRSYYPDDELLVAARVQFQQGNYGRSHAMFEKALGVVPDDPQALLGYAASADMLRRFDKSDQAYRKLQPMIGNRIEFHNNYGYSLMLRGELVAARNHFIRAYEIDPTNEFAANNLELLRNSVNYPKRAPGDLRGI
ncbi:tetratricopeptide repeat protein [Roseovarius autotrophicus]|uniref:tetratricopeptide repeat protein n=1 Tax=Roseovarius autotrophicus TaxID=2824121 RepID=UPI001B36918F|nr:tetratricopeptide repeat protein [Roseovarius autotrophicus]